MRTARRHVLQLAGLSALTAGFGVRANADSGPTAPPTYSGAYAAEFDRVVQALTSFYRQEGYADVEPLPLQTGTADFNGGLRYDETGVFDGTNEMALQPVARMEDADRVDRRDVLFAFNIFATSWHSGDSLAASLERAFAVLIDPVGLSPDRFLLVSVPVFEAFRPTVESIGLDWDRQVVLRNADEARAAGDGSGYFRHPDPSIDLAVPTVGLHYWIGERDPVVDRAYPLPADWTEVGEQGLDQEVTMTAAGMGVERLVFARTGLLPD